MHDSRTAFIEATFKRALEEILARVFVSSSEKKAIAVAYSGGLDSAVLLHLAKAYADAQGMALHAFHVHHGLSPQADAWLAHCQAMCDRAGIAFEACRVRVSRDTGAGLEAAARAARYAALGAMCRAQGVTVLLTAHHQDDQAETVLLQMLRGAGLSGMSGMEAISQAPDLLGDKATLIARPLLSLTRNDLVCMAGDKDLRHIEDESNLNPHHPRNALRNDILPVLEKYFPSYRDCLCRSAGHVGAAQRLLEELAAQDWAACRDGDGLAALALEKMSVERAGNLLRYWLVSQGLPPPSAAWLAEALRQLRGMRADAQVCVQWGGRELRRYRDQIVLTTRHPPGTATQVDFTWQGDASLSFPPFGGVLHFELAENGLAQDFLLTQRLRLQYRSGGDSLKLAPKRPAKKLKDWYQECAIPPWERQALPVIVIDQSILFAAGLGQDCRFPQASPGILLRWEPYEPG